MLLINRDIIIFFFVTFLYVSKYLNCAKSCLILLYGRVQNPGGLRRQTFLNQQSCLPAYGRKR